MMMAKRGTFSHIQRTISQLSEMVELFGTLYLSEGLEKVVAQIHIDKYQDAILFYCFYLNVYSRLGSCC